MLKCAPILPVEGLQYSIDSRMEFILSFVNIKKVLRL